MFGVHCFKMLVITIVTVRLANRRATSSSYWSTRMPLRKAPKFVQVSSSSTFSVAFSFELAGFYLTNVSCLMGSNNSNFGRDQGIWRSRAYLKRKKHE